MSSTTKGCWCFLRGAVGAGCGALLVLVGLVGCLDSPATHDSSVAVRIGGEDIPYSRFESYLETIGDRATGLESTVLSALFDQFVTEELLVRLAVDRQLVLSGGDYRRAAVALLEATEEGEVGDREIAAYYEQRRQDFDRPERVHLRQILVEDRTAAESALAELEGGAAFVDVAERTSIDPSAPRGGDQGELARDDLPQTFVETIFELEEGQVSGILPADYGYHIFQVVDRLPEEVVSLEDATPKIREVLEIDRRDRRLERLVEEARGRYNVRIEEHNLPFVYQTRDPAHGNRSSP